MAFALRRLARVLVLMAVGGALVAPSTVRAAEPAFATAEVAATTYFEQLEHNVADVVGKFADGASYSATFLQNFEQTGGIERWGYPTSAIFEETPGSLTQYYQRGVIDWRPPPSGGAHTFLRRLAWDYVGGGLGGSEDQGVELGLTNPNPGDELGPWGHKVSNASVEGVDIGFADFFHRLGGVASFGFPKTDARRDDHPEAVLHDPTRPVDSRIRQYFQAAVLEYHPESAHAPVKLRLLGDTLRDSRYPGESWRRYMAFGPEAPLEVGDRIETNLPKRLGPHGSTVDDVAAFLEPSLLRVDTDVGCGSGFLVTESGYAVTTWNLVAHARTHQVSSPRGFRAWAQLVAGDAELNLALLRVPGDDHIPALWGDSNGLDAQAELVALGYDAAQVGNLAAIGCQSEPTPKAISLSNENFNRWLGIRPRYDVGHDGGPVASRTGYVVGVSTARYPGDRRIDDMIPAAEAQPLVASWIDELSRGGTPTLPYRPRFDQIVLAERDRLACSGTGDRSGTIEVHGGKIELTATVVLTASGTAVGGLSFSDISDSRRTKFEDVYFGRLSYGRGLFSVSWIRYHEVGHTVMRSGGLPGSSIGESFQLRFVYDSGSVGLYIDGSAVHLESGLPYSENIWLRLNCHGVLGAPAMFYDGLRISGIPPWRN